MPENISGTLTLSDYNAAHTLNFTRIIYKQYTIATIEYLRLF